MLKKNVDAHRVARGTAQMCKLLEENRQKTFRQSKQLLHRQKLETATTA
jgi:hypothetical protein